MNRFLPVAVSWIIGATLAFSSRAALPEPPSAAAPYRNEAEAVAAGRRLGIGSATLEGPKTAEVATFQTWTLVYTAGPAGVEPGGGIRVGLRHVLNWTPPQTGDPKAAGHFAAKAAGGAPVKIFIPKKRHHFFGPYFAWQNMVEVTLPERGLEPGQTLRLTYGDRSGGGPGTRIQPFDETNFVFKCYVDAPGKGDYLPLANSPSIRIVAAAPRRLSLVMPSDAVAGRPTWCIVRAEDRYGNPAMRYRGTVRLHSSDTSAELPGAFTFTEADGGAHCFEKVTLRATGSHTVSVTDGKLRAAGNPVRVARARPEQLLLWGDLHGHTLYSDGRGTVEQYYDFARDFAGLDFCAVSDHAFEIMDAMWKHTKAVTNRRNHSGRFVTFHGYEWSGNTKAGGDHNVYFLDDDPPLYRSDNYYHPRNLQVYHGPDPKVPHVKDLFARIEKHLRDKDVLCIPHWGGRHGNPAFHNPKVQRLIEVFSEHRRSEDWAASFLQSGHRLGVMASGDDHYGNPGHGYLHPKGDWDRQEIGMAAVAVYAPEHTRESIFRALYDRRVYATSGDRIILDVRADGHPMGSEYKTLQPPVIEVEAIGTVAIKLVQIKKDSREVFAAKPGKTAVRLRWQDPEFQPGRPSYYYVRVVQENDEEAISSPIWVN